VQRLVHKAGTLVHLTKTEYEMLLCLLRHAGSALTHNQILTQVWGATYQDRPEYIRVHMAGLRQKLEDNPAAPQYLKPKPASDTGCVCRRGKGRLIQHFVAKNPFYGAIGFHLCQRSADPRFDLSIFDLA